MIGYDRNWETEFPWLEVVTDDGKAVGMLCKLCRKHNAENKYNHSKVWNETPCVCMCKDSVRHQKCMLQLETAHQAADTNGEYLRHRCPFSMRAIQCLYWLVKLEIPYTNHYGTLIEAMKFIRCNVFKHLLHGENAKQH